ncbi:helix-turn-helix domain-containing protein [Klebsiella aerogenes]|uniref:helix-turn-helix domain-containing protein n=1 Tax=Klebsiella aerogenes TaxID=548 RepID=UPI0034D1DA5D
MTAKDDPNQNQTSAKRIAQVLAEKGWNKSQLAREIGISVQAVQHWAKGGSRPSGQNLAKLAEVSGKPEYWFFTSDEDQSAPLMSESNYAGLREDERQLLEVYNELPSVERHNLLSVFQMRLQELKKYYKNYFNKL